jgi:hypothetical protein
MNIYTIFLSLLMLLSNSIQAQTTDYLLSEYELIGFTQSETGWSPILEKREYKRKEMPSGQGFAQSDSISNPLDSVLFYMNKNFTDANGQLTKVTTVYELQFLNGYIKALNDVMRLMREYGVVR